MQIGSPGTEGGRPAAGVAPMVLKARSFMVASASTMARVGHFRGHERRAVTLSAFLRHERTGWVREARVLDLSLAGAGLLLAEPVEVGTPVALELAAPTLWDPLSIRGAVVWCQRQSGADARTRVGVAFE